MKILVVPDSFKGSLTSAEVCETIKNSILSVNPDYLVDTLPFADGGEGFSECALNICNGEKHSVKCHNIYGTEIDGYFVSVSDTAIIECATASGLLSRKQVMIASSYGTGEIIDSAIKAGFKKIILGLGGTGCCDGGIGALAALGAKFYDENWNIINKPKANDLNFIFGVDFKDVNKSVDITYACDVENPYYGKNGAAYVFAPQKGARQTDVVELDEGLQRLNAFFSTDLSKVKGSGAAGGICGGLYAVLSGKINSGFEVLAELSNLEEKIKDCDIVITGEGKTDSQTLMGKLPYRISKLAKKYNKKCVIISGAIEDVQLGDDMYSLVGDGVSNEEAIANAKEILSEKAKCILK